MVQLNLQAITIDKSRLSQVTRLARQGRKGLVSHKWVSGIADGVRDGR
jgi:hypothetical protein